VDTRDDKQIEVPYNRDLRALEDALAAVRRPGDFSVHGVLETPMPLRSRRNSSVRRAEIFSATPKIDELIEEYSLALGCLARFLF
jgi:hypothetical protein